MSEGLETIKALAEKLQAVADPARGSTPGEVEAAKLKLERLLERHGLTLAELAKEETVLHPFAVRNEQELDLLYRVTHWIIESDSISYVRPRSNGKRKGNRRLIVQIRMTAAQSVDVRACFTYYLHELDARNAEIENRMRGLELEKKHLVRAIANKYNLFPPSDGKPGKASKLNLAELEAMVQAMRRMRAGRWEKPAGALATGALLLTGGAGS